MNYKSNFPPLKFKRSDPFFILLSFDLVKNCSIIRPMRVRTKDCFKCKDWKEVLYRDIKNGFVYVESV